jgi:radical SAM superfamily enzyme YgiQ (UPF0313 family)
MSGEHPIRGIVEILRRVEKPARYAGGEYGSISKGGDLPLSIALSYPDLYEIGMSNSAVRILYHTFNSIDGVACERVFAPAPDFEAELSARQVPLFSLETRRPLSDFDLIGFSIGYELTLTNIFAILESGGIPLLNRERQERDPIVIAGGPAVTNPAPFGPFVDCVFIGEAEGWAEESLPLMVDMKKRGAGRGDLLGFLRSTPSIWHREKTGGTVRAVWRGFTARASVTGFPVPSMRTVQDHGTVEIMRGCPHACRFCHAACYYRPVRVKGPELIRQEVHALVHEAGYREITLSSLSSGGFKGIGALVTELNALYAPFQVSFSLPSLHVDSMSLSVLAGISEVRKSGLTFAVETPKPEWQALIGKSVTLDKTVALMLQAKSLGWKNAKFYFMVGLPASFGEDESSPIVDFLLEVKSRTGMGVHANVAAFIPKPHTSFQRAPQLSERAALEKIMSVKKNLRGDGFKIGYHAPFLSFLEGIVSRGDERAGFLALAAYGKGARLDAWEEYIRPEAWRSAIDGAGWSVETDTCRERNDEETLPWEGIRLETPVSAADEAAAYKAAASSPKESKKAPVSSQNEAERILFSFRKSGRASFISHLDLMQIFERALPRAGYYPAFTEGFNPKPRMQFASPLGLGIESEEEVASVEIRGLDSCDAFISRMNPALPEGISVTRCAVMGRLKTGKKPSLMAAYWGSEYRVRAAAPLDRAFLSELEGGTGIRAETHPEGAVLIVPAEPASRPVLARLRADPAFSLMRVRTRALGDGGAPVSYFEAFRSSDLT